MGITSAITNNIAQNYGIDKASVKDVLDVFKQIGGGINSSQNTINPISNERDQITKLANEVFGGKGGQVNLIA